MNPSDFDVEEVPSGLEFPRTHRRTYRDFPLSDPIPSDVPISEFSGETLSAPYLRNGVLKQKRKGNSLFNRGKNTSSTPISIRFEKDSTQALERMTSRDKADLIRESTRAELIKRGLLPKDAES